MRSQVSIAAGLASIAHDGQVDKAGVPYILHPMRVGAALVTHGEVAVVAGLLHDVLEDSDLTEWTLLDAGISPEAVEAVKAVTKRASERGSYDVSVARALEHPVGRWVKAADLLDNFRRLDGVPDEATRTRLFRKYVGVEPLVRQVIPGFGLLRDLPHGDVLYWG